MTSTGRTEKGSGRIYTPPMAETKMSPPPRVLDCARVLEYLVIGNNMQFSGRSLLFVDGKELGPVPCLAICEEKDSGGVLLFHCTNDWAVLGCSAHQSVSEARQRAEHIYRGSSDQWIHVSVSQAERASRLSINSHSTQ
jgi:hypothetical protein